MGVTVIEPGRLVRVEPDTLGAKEILEFAEALIEEHGWIKTKAAPGAAAPSRPAEQTTKTGFTLHGAIGEAARRSSTPHSMGTAYHGKDSSPARPLRNAVDVLLVEATHGNNDIGINDSADTVDEVLKASRQARGAEAL